MPKTMIKKPKNKSVPMTKKLKVARVSKVKKPKKALKDPNMQPEIVFEKPSKKVSF